MFQERIKTGIIINNSTIKEPIEFFQKARRIFRNQILKALAVSLVKVNVILTGDFILSSTGQIKLKAFSTKNVLIDHEINFKTWYKETVEQKLLTELS